VEGSLPTGSHDARIDESLEVMAECRRRHVHMGLNGPGRGALRACLHDVAQDRQTDRMAESSELLGVVVQLSAHVSISIIFEVADASSISRASLDK
jgi:hypothetical protein